MPFYFGLKEDGIALINNDGPMKLHKDQARELEERRAKLYYLRDRVGRAARVKEKRV